MLFRFVAIPLLTSAAVLQAGAETVTFEKHVRPILKAQCFHCHGEEEEIKGGLDVRLVRFMLKGGKSGTSIVPGQAAQSHLLEVIKSGEMPKGAAPLKEEEIAIIERWIEEGAKTARPEPMTLSKDDIFTEEDREWWSLQPIQHPPVPKTSAAAEGNAVDAFVEQKLQASGLKFSPPADARVFIRRATFDLIGLPPSPEEVEAFEKEHEKNPQAAVGRLIDRLLASPAYGERWGRHWLDIAGYSDSDGFTEKDLERPYAYHYRDYVVRALNRDKPFDEFVREQLAGDEMVPPPHTNLSAEEVEKITATGFLRMAPDGTGVMNDKATQNAAIADTIKIVSTAFYGMTIACAQCHDHRYDPISHADYFRLRAVFEPGFDTTKWRVPKQRLVSLYNDAQRAESAKIEVEAKKVDDARLAKQAEFITEVLEKELAKVAEKDRDALRLAYRTPVKERKPEQEALLKANPRVQKLSGGSLYLYDHTYKTKHADTLKKMQEEATAVRDTKPKEEFLHAFVEVPKPANAVPKTFLFHRGDHEQPKQPVQPGDLSILSSWREVNIAEKAADMPTTGRRLAFAKSITDGKHPLLARVIVNQVWKRHFGNGIVNTLDDFGYLGEKPSHPELLDWLASEFMQNGWSLKRLHRQIMTSMTFRQSSQRNPQADGLDPDNRLLSRMNVLRLEAETLRDSLLAVSGKLNDSIGGKPVPVSYNEQGQVIMSEDTRDAAGRQTGKHIPLNGLEYRRSLYVQARRTMPLELFAAFDAPSMTDASCASRPVTTVSPQSLLLMNNLYMREHAQDFADRLLKEVGNKDITQQAVRAWDLCFGREPSTSELAAATEFLGDQTAYYKENPAKLERVSGQAEKNHAAPELLGLSALCHALMSSNEFLYVD